VGYASLETNHSILALIRVTILRVEEFLCGIWDSANSNILRDQLPWRNAVSRVLLVVLIAADVPACDDDGDGSEHSVVF